VSASNYATCPRCKKALEGTAGILARRLRDEYGTIPVADYTELQNRLAEATVRAAQPGQTFREDYEIYGAETGTVTVSYGGTCSQCGLELSFTEEHDIPGATE
jgi:hypothetical protein